LAKSAGNLFPADLSPYSAEKSAEKSRVSNSEEDIILYECRDIF